MDGQEEPRAVAFHVEGLHGAPPDERPNPWSRGPVSVLRSREWDDWLRSAQGAAVDTGF